MEVIVQQIMQALVIMVLGMGLVFLFLSLLILAVKLVAWRYKPVVAPSIQDNAAVKTSESYSIEPSLVAAISTAIYQYRAKA
ncbi:OadG family protein [Shewanella sp. AS1]|uniref:OadG family protein n=1 Tax=Shewanella sp. AS1 TaxID=2907626 RepID=UPI001F160F12|nr:OadG family transporter subunit [Shewanella sp. AS1]MCE9679150.1 OadG family protein [Shewanella sp. AS1]